MSKVAIVRSSYYEDLVSSLEAGAKKVLHEGGISEEDIEVTQVPGAFEIPLACKRLLELREVEGIIALGVIIQGETHHAGEIARACTDGLMHLQLKYGIPIVHEVLFVEERRHAEVRCMGEHNKGREAARTLLEMLRTRPSAYSTTMSH